MPLAARQEVEAEAAGGGRGRRAVHRAVATAMKNPFEFRGVAPHAGELELGHGIDEEKAFDGGCAVGFAFAFVYFFYFGTFMSGFLGRRRWDDEIGEYGLRGRLG